MDTAVDEELGLVLSGLAFQLRIMYMLIADVSSEIAERQKLGNRMVLTILTYFGAYYNIYFPTFKNSHIGGSDGRTGT